MSSTVSPGAFHGFGIVSRVRSVSGNRSLWIVWTRNPVGLAVAVTSATTDLLLPAEHALELIIDGVWTRQDGLGMTLPRLSAGAHVLQVAVGDGCGNVSDWRRLEIAIDDDSPTVRVVKPRLNGWVIHDRPFTAAVSLGDFGSGISTAELIWREGEGEFSVEQRLCSFSGPWLIGPYAHSRECRVSESLPIGRRQLVLQVRDRAGNRTEQVHFVNVIRLPAVIGAGSLVSK
ncbi:MAG: hypothetical protein HYV63_29655 [Candidatus Schekmanbacteria bacterium]|nr:hypothetical protein [Candidatus Schekmanbacteria bacterium]